MKILIPLQNELYLVVSEGVKAIGGLVLDSKLCYIPSTIDSNKISFSGQWVQTRSKVLHILINHTWHSLIIN